MQNFASFLFFFDSNCQLTNEARAEGKLVCIMPCKEEEDAVKICCNFAPEINKKIMKVYVLTMTSQLGLFAISEGRTKLACVMLSGAKNLTEGKKGGPAE